MRLAYALRALLLVGIGFLPQAQLSAAELEYGQGLLWKIESPGLTPSYLFGTIHSEDARVLNVPPAVQTVFDTTRIYVMEALLDDAAMATMSSAMLFSDGHTLPQVVSAATYAKTVAAMSEYGLPEAALQVMKPWAVAVTLSLPQPKTGVVLDMVLLQKAQAQGKPTAGLETVAEQVSVLDSFSLADQVTMLEDSLRQIPARDSTYAAMHSAYLARDLAALASLSDAQIAQGDRALGKKIQVQMLDKRNRRMVERMQSYLKQGDAFIAIGALHLPGPQGVLALLAAQGYRITAVY